MSDETQMVGHMLIARERARQITEEGYTHEHDAHHDLDDLLLASIAYLRACLTPDARPGSPRQRALVEWWPWDHQDFKPDDPLRNLEKAGALVAAALDRALVGVAGARERAGAIADDGLPHEPEFYVTAEEEAADV